MRYKELSKAVKNDWIFFECFRATVEDNFSARAQKPNWNEMTYKFNQKDYRQTFGAGNSILTNYSTNQGIKTDFSYYEALSRIGSGGTWIPTLYTTKNDKGFIEGRFFAVDFEEKENREVPHIETELEKAKNLGLSPIAFYETMNSTIEKPRFRFLWEASEAVTNANEYKAIAAGLIRTFGGDTACKSAVQFFAGGRNLHFARSYAKTNIEKLRALKVAEIPQRGRREAIFDAGEATKERVLIKDIDWAVLEQNCRLWRETIAGDYWASYADIQHLALSAFSMNGGAKRLREAIRNNPQFYNNTKHNIEYYLKAISAFKKLGHEERCSNETCPFYEECRHIGFITDKVRQCRTTYYKQKEVTRIPLKEAEEWLSDILQTVAKSSAQIFFIKAPVGLGKTEAFKNLDDYFPFETLSILQPTHALKGETAGRIESSLSSFTVQPEILVDEETSERDKRYYAAGLQPPAHSIKTSNVYSPQAKIKLMTQSHYLLHQERYANDVVICDEDIFQRLVQTKTVSQDVLVEGLRQLSKDGVISKMDYRAVEDWIDEHKVEVLTNIHSAFPAIKVNIEKLYAIAYEDYRKLPQFNIFDFIGKEEFIFSSDKIGVCRKEMFPAPKKFIMLSATLDVDTIKKFYPNLDFYFYECPRVQYRGEITFDTAHTYSRQDISKRDLKKLNTELRATHEDFFKGDKPFLITYKSYTKKLGEALDLETVDKMWIGATEGKDCLKGRKVIVMGSNRINDFDLAVMSLGMAVPPTNFARKRRRLRRSGIEFDFYGFVDDNLEELYEWLIDTETIQDVGRARALRENTSVLVCGVPFDF